jgi:bifunctional oligoribonuclease and PAP phosphatase NrnA
MSLESIAAIIRSHQDFLIVSHANPDGDSVSSQLAFGRLLGALGKKYRIVNESMAPGTYEFLPDFQTITLFDEKQAYDFTAAVILDIGEWERMGAPQKLIDPARHAVINLDHHESNNGFGQATYVDPHACSTAILVYHLYQHMNQPITPAVATQLYTGILTDTGGFRFSNTSGRALKACAELVDCGVDPAFIMQKIYFEKSALAVKVLGQVLATLELHYGDRIAAVHLDTGVMQKIGPYPRAEIVANTEGLIDFVRAIKGVEMALFFREEREGVKVSLRSNSDHLNMNHFAGTYGGGGHIQAAGANLTGLMATAKKQVIEEAIAFMENNHGSLKQP